MKPLPDAGAREKISTLLDKNLVVEAAAGTGKTTCLVARICEMIKAGALRDNARFAAVTFTLKAANELRQRLEAELERQLRDPALAPDQRVAMTLGLDAVAECHIGTIHSFCARLLRERPVEAGVSPDFRELDQERDEEYRLRAWNEFSRLLDAGRYGELTNTFRTYGLDLDTLGKGFLRFAEYPDVDVWTGSGFAIPGGVLVDFVSGLEKFVKDLGGFATLLDGADPGNDELIPILRIACRRTKRLLPRTMGDAYRLALLFKPKPQQKKRHWKTVFAHTPEETEERYNAYLTFYENTVKPFQQKCRAYVYASAMTAYRLARGIYDRLRREDGVLNFQDLLLTTAKVLRNHPDVRRELAGRFQRILVDEVQDTDPIQAEILLLLASADMEERDWRKVAPRPGSLFIVGDPKQSIYRFRRADIVVYQELKDMVAKNGGELLELTANFRSQPGILDWVNKTFALGPGEELDAEAAATAGKFSPVDSPYSPAYVPLTPGRDETAEECLKGVYGLETLAMKRGKIDNAAILADEAERIAAFIRDALDRGAMVPDRNGVRPVEPGDFMIVTYKKSAAPLYAAALGRLGIESEVSAGGALAASPVLDMLASYLTALANPDDPVAALAVLRGPLFGVSDQELYRWKKAGRRFLFPVVSSLPDHESEDAGDDDAGNDHDHGLEKVRTALTTMRGHQRLFRRGDPISGLGRIVNELGLWAFAALGDDPADSVGALATAIELLKAARTEIAGPGELAARLQWVRERYDGDVMPATPPEGRAVRVMNVHKTKGLEAPVVFLTCTRTVKTQPVRFAVDRDGDAVEAGMVLAGGEFGNVVVAAPEDWEELAGREELFLQAERTRLNYVAATRAGSMLVVSTHPSGKRILSAFLPGGDAAPVAENSLEEPSEPPAPRLEASPPGIDAGRLERAASIREERMRTLASESYRLERAKPEVAAASVFSLSPFGGDGDEGVDPDLAADIGEIMHSLLEVGGEETRLAELAKRMLREYDLPRAMAGELVEKAAEVLASDLWRRAGASPRCLREVPFTVFDTADGVETVRRGVIDLVFFEEDGWVIVDYKSDRLSPHTDADEAASRHAGQLNAYAEAWEKATGERVAEAIVYFVHRGEWVDVLHDS